MRWLPDWTVFEFETRLTIPDCLRQLEHHLYFGDILERNRETLLYSVYLDKSFAKSKRKPKRKHDENRKRIPFCVAVSKTAANLNPLSRMMGAKAIGSLRREEDVTIVSGKIRMLAWGKFTLAVLLFFSTCGLLAVLANPSPQNTLWFVSMIVGLYGMVYVYPMLKYREMLLGAIKQSLYVESEKVGS
jgi:hypothetical protein